MRVQTAARWPRSWWLAHELTGFRPFLDRHVIAAADLAGAHGFILELP
jgi:hypothetical protein